MKKRIFISILAIAIVIAFAFPFKNYASNSFFEAKETEALKGEEVELVVNLSKIDYEKFEFNLVTDATVSDISTENDIDLEKDEEANEISFEIDKSKTDLSKITFSYKVSEDSKIGDILTFVATVTNSENEEENLVEQIEIKIVEEKSNSENSVFANTSQNFAGSENSVGSFDFENNQNSGSDLESMDRSTFENGETSFEFSQENSFSNSSDSESFSMASGANLSEAVSDTEEVTYNGSGNNYLSSLEISGYSLNKTFSKDSNTYFVTISDEAVSSISISATAEDSSASVCVYGNEDLESGLNKILVNVTAENGNVRTYRIYVTIGE